MFYTIVVVSTAVIGLVPFAQVVAERAALRRDYQGSHAKAGEYAGPEGRRKQATALRCGAATIIGALVMITNPHGLLYWEAIGAITVFLLWEAAPRLAARLVRKYSGEDTS